MTREIPERDWKTLRRLTPRLLDRFCQKVLDEAVRLGKGSTQTSHERYLNLYRYLKKQDHPLGEAFDDHKRSTAFFKLASWRPKVFRSVSLMMSCTLPHALTLEFPVSVPAKMLTFIPTGVSFPLGVTRERDLQTEILVRTIHSGSFRKVSRSRPNDARRSRL